MATVTRKAGPGVKILADALAQLQGVSGKVGWLESSKYPDGTSVAYVAAINEFGYPPKGIPPRMGLRQLVKALRAPWGRVAETGAKRVMSGKASAIDMLELLGAVAEGDLRKHISNVVDPVLAKSTLRNRASRLGIELEALTGTGAKPLVEPVMSKRNGGGAGGYLLATLTHVVGLDAKE